MWWCGLVCHFFLPFFPINAVVFVDCDFVVGYQTVRYMLCEWGSIFIVTSANVIIELKEKGVEAKLQDLFKQNMYSLAITLANTSEYDSANICDIYRMYGDHLYAKGDYDSACKQYIVTIGTVEPSYVIRQFLTAQQIENLTTYLEELHKANANADHTTLLLNCYTKLKVRFFLGHFVIIYWRCLLE